MGAVAAGWVPKAKPIPCLAPCRSWPTFAIHLVARSRSDPWCSPPRSSPGCTPCGLGSRVCVSQLARCLPPSPPGPRALQTIPKLTGEVTDASQTTPCSPCPPPRAAPHAQHLLHSPGLGMPTRASPLCSLHAPWLSTESPRGVPSHGWVLGSAFSARRGCTAV